MNLSVNVAGTADIERIEIMRGLHVACCLPAVDAGVDNKIRVAWGGARHRGRGRTASWDGSLDIVAGGIVDAQGYAFDSPPACRMAIQNGG